MIRTLTLDNFRSYDQAHFEFAQTTVIIGPNGVGKTNILEAISMLSLTTSWKTEKDSEVVQWGKPFARVTSEEKELIVQAHPYMKRLKINGVSKRAFQVIGHFPTILFQPDDLQFVYGSPTFRRHHLDRVLSQTSTAYTEAILELNQVLKQRNRLLKNIQEGIAGPSELSFWDLELARVQSIVREHRERFVEHLNACVPGIFASMVPEGGDIVITYVMSPRHAESDFANHLRMHREREIGAGVSLYGPHREDIEIHWGGHLVHQGMSRGQVRSLLVALKIAELDYITKSAGTKPVLLLDDIFSELDATRRERLFSILGEYQVIMTTTELGATGETLKTRPDVSILNLKESVT